MSATVSRIFWTKSQYRFLYLSRQRGQLPNIKALSHLWWVFYFPNTKWVVFNMWQEDRSIRWDNFLLDDSANVTEDHYWFFICEVYPFRQYIYFVLACNTIPLRKPYDMIYCNNVIKMKFLENESQISQQTHSCPNLVLTTKYYSLDLLL